jgi:hypothetical protein
VSARERNEGLWERAFQLGYFILMDRSMARECVARAIEKLAAHRSREKRRAYWRGRKQGLMIRRISRPLQDTLQWLVCLESEACERQQELQGQLTETDMVVRYVKHLAQATTVNSSFHVNIAFNRLLRSYTTPEVQQIYELATERYPGAEEYRKAKGRLLKLLAARFEGFLRIRTTQYGEHQFEAHEQAEPWWLLIEQCLEAFAPWSAARSCWQDSVGAMAAGTSQLAARARGLADSVESSRCHWFMHSSCYGRLAQQLGFDPPEERLAVPRFLHGDGQDRNAGAPERRTEPLSEDEIHGLNERMASAIGAPHLLASASLQIVAHGIVYARIDPRRDELCSFEIPQGTGLLEIRSDTPGSPRILAVHWLDYNEAGGFLECEYTLEREGGRELALRVVPASGADEPYGDAALVTISAHSKSSLRERLRRFGSLFEGERYQLGTAALSVALVTVGGLAAGAYLAFRLSQDHLIMSRMAAEIAEQKAAVAALQRVSPGPIQAIARYQFRSESPRLRGTGSPGEPLVSFAPGQSLAILELPVAEGAQALYRVTLSSFPEEQERMSETALQPVRKGEGWFVEFALPARLVEGGTHYVLALTPLGGAESTRYVFEVQKS